MRAARPLPQHGTRSAVLGQWPRGARTDKRGAHEWLALPLRPQALVLALGALATVEAAVGG